MKYIYCKTLESPDISLNPIKYGFGFIHPGRVTYFYDTSIYSGDFR